MTTANNAAETVIGALVVMTAAGFLFYVSQTAGFRVGAQSYPLAASFRSIEGISVGSDVRLAGIKVGTVTQLVLDVETYEARVTFSMDRAVQVPEDSDIRVSQEGLLGGSFLEIMPGASDFMLSSGDEILNTQSSVSLLNLLLRFGMGTE
jgi:phospholipid/cholesterol/gamma-HCH transport system substrate-binding protein